MFPETNKMGPRKANILCLVGHGVFFGHFPTSTDYFKISEDYRRLTELSQDYRRLTKMSEDYRRCPETTEDVRRLPETSKKKSEDFRLHFCLYHIHMGKKNFFAGYRIDFFSGREIPVTHPN